MDRTGQDDLHALPTDRRGVGAEIRHATRQASKREDQAIGPMGSRAMSYPENQKRDAAIKRFQEREAQSCKQAAEDEEKRRSQERRTNEKLETWASAAFPTINQSIRSVSEDFARRGSPLLISSTPAQNTGSAVYDVRRSGNLRSLAKLRFELKEDQVVATTTAKGTVFPSSVPLNGINSDWVELVAEEVLIAMLDGNRMQIPD